MEVPPPTAEPLRQLDLPSGAAVQNTNKCEEENMKRKTMALMLALSMCLSLLSACGSGNTATDDKPPESENVVSSTEQPEESEEPEESKEQPEESEEPKEEEPEESEEPNEESNAGTELLALLQEEWNNGFVEGEGPRHTYYDATDRKAFIHNGVVYIRGVKGYGDVWDYCSYDIASKELHESVAISADAKGYGWYAGNYFMDGNFYFANDSFKEAELSTRIYDYNGTPLQSFLHTGHGFAYFFFEKGILAIDIDDSSVILLSHNLEKIADIPAPQREVEHGLKENFEVDADSTFAAGGTVYTKVSDKGSSHLYRLNTDTCEWEDTGNVSDFTNQVGSFCGKYVTRRDGIYDYATGEQVLEYGELYPAVSEWGHDNLCYFGGDKYLGVKDSEYRWVNLKDLSMSDPLPFPDVHRSNLFILDDTYCVYEDQYGWFLWNYNTGEEETIVLFEQ